MGWIRSAHAVCQRKSHCNLRSRARQGAAAASRSNAGASRAPCQNRGPMSPARGSVARATSGAHMGFLAGKRLVITGLLSNRSIAYGIARACHREGAELAFSYVGERFRDRIVEFAAEFGSRAGVRLRRRRRRPDRGHVRAARRGLAAVRRLRAFDRLRAARGDCRRLPRRPVARGLPHRARHLGLQLPGPGQGRPAPPAPGQRAADADLPGRRARRAQLQHHGPGQGLARGQRALPGRQPGPEGHSRQRHLGRADPHAGGVGHQGLRQAARRGRPSRRRCAAT